MQLSDGLQVIGPAFLVAVAYLDPGNWATAIESGSRFGYDQLWILVLSNVIAIHLQALSSRLGLASGKHLAQVCRDSYPPGICLLLWLMTEASIVALDLTMVLGTSPIPLLAQTYAGTAIGLNLLFKIPPVTCIVLTALDALALFLLFPQTALRQAEQWTAVLVFAVLACFVIDLFISKPPLHSVLSGLYPTLHRDDIYSAVSLLGANVMPHNFYLHSALVAGQSSHNDKVTARRCYLNSLDIACALGLALLVNVAVLLVAASTFHSAGVKVATLQEAHDLLEQILNSRIAPLAFGLALLLTGQMSTFTSTIAGQVVMSGFVGLTTSTLNRRLTTRALAIAPALFVQLMYGAEGTYRMLVIAQVVLAMQLPFTLIPLIKSTSSHAIMGVFASSWLRSSTAWAASFVVFTANMLMLVDMLWMETSEQVAAREEEQGFADKGFDEWLAHVMEVMTRSPRQFLGTCAVAIAALMAMALLMWMSVHPVRVQGSLRARKITSSNKLGKDYSEQQSSADAEAEDPERAALFQGTAMSDSDPPAVSFVNLLFADLPMKHVRRLWAALRTTATKSSAMHPPLTQALLDQHTLHAAHTAAELQLDRRLQPYQANVQRPLLDWRSQHQRQLRWHRACERMQLVAPSECSLSTLDGMQSLQSVQTTASAVSEPGGGKGHRMGRGSRRKLANLMCAIWEQHWDTHGQPVSCATAGHSDGLFNVIEPVLFSSARETLVELCDAVCEVLQVPGVGSMLPHSQTPGSQQNLQGQEWFHKSGCGGVKADQIAVLGPRLAACAVVTRTLHDNAVPLREAAASAPAESVTQTASKACADGWASVVQALAELWPHVGQFVQDVSGDQSHAQDNAHCRPGSGGISDQTEASMHQSGEAILCSEQSMFMSGWGATVGVHPHESLSSGPDTIQQSAGVVPRLCFLGFCLWCTASLLQLASVEPRPELWGRYVAALNHLQGPLFITLNLAAALQGSEWLPAGRSGPWCAADLSSYGLTGTPRSIQVKVLQSLEGVHAELRQLLQQVEAHIDTCGASHNSDRTAVAFAKGKFNILSLIKRLRAHLARRDDSVAVPQEGALHLRTHSTADVWQTRHNAPKRWHPGHARPTGHQSAPVDRSAMSAGSWRGATHAGAHDWSRGKSLRKHDSHT